MAAASEKPPLKRRRRGKEGSDAPPPPPAAPSARRSDAESPKVAQPVAKRYSRVPKSGGVGTACESPTSHEDQQDLNVLERRLDILTQIMARTGPSPDDLRYIMQVPELADAMSLQRQGKKTEATTLLAAFKADLEKKVARVPATSSTSKPTSPDARARDAKAEELARVRNGQGPFEAALEKLRAKAQAEETAKLPQGGAGSAKEGRRPMPSTAPSLLAEQPQATPPLPAQTPQVEMKLSVPPPPPRPTHRVCDPSVVAASTESAGPARALGASSEPNFSSVFKWHEGLLVVNADEIKVVDSNLTQNAMNAAFNLGILGDFSGMSDLMAASKVPCEGIANNHAYGELKSGSFTGVRVAAEYGNVKTRPRALALGLILACAASLPEDVAAEHPKLNISHVNDLLGHKHFQSMLAQVIKLQQPPQGATPVQAISDRTRNDGLEEELKSSKDANVLMEKELKDLRAQRDLFYSQVKRGETVADEALTLRKQHEDIIVRLSKQNEEQQKQLAENIVGSKLAETRKTYFEEEAHKEKTSKVVLEEKLRSYEKKAEMEADLKRQFAKNLEQANEKSVVLRTELDQAERTEQAKCQSEMTRNEELCKELQEKNAALRTRDSDADHAKKLIKTEREKFDKAKKDYAAIQQEMQKERQDQAEVKTLKDEIETLRSESVEARVWKEEMVTSRSEYAEFKAFKEQIEKLKSENVAATEKLETRCAQMVDQENAVAERTAQAEVTALKEEMKAVKMDSDRKFTAGASWRTQALTEKMEKLKEEHASEIAAHVVARDRFENGQKSAWENVARLQTALDQQRKNAEKSVQAATSALNCERDKSRKAREEYVAEKAKLEEAEKTALGEVAQLKIKLLYANDELFRANDENRKMAAKQAPEDAEARLRTAATEAARSRTLTGKLRSEIQALESRQQESSEQHAREQSELRAQLAKANEEAQEAAASSSAPAGDEHVKTLTEELLQERKNTAENASQNVLKVNMEKKLVKKAEALLKKEEQKVRSMEEQAQAALHRMENAENQASEKDEEIRRLREELQASTLEADTEPPSSGSEDLDEAPTVKKACRHEFSRVERNHICDKCDQTGTLFSCLKCNEYDLCGSCYGEIEEKRRAKASKKTKSHSSVQQDVQIVIDEDESALSSSSFGGGKPPSTSPAQPPSVQQAQPLSHPAQPPSASPAQSQDPSMQQAPWQRHKRTLPQKKPPLNHMVEKW